jgi:hypothetical protein
MIFVFSAFILSGQQVIGEIGIGLAAGVLLDAFLLRTCPAAPTGGYPAGSTASSRTCPSNPPPRQRRPKAYQRPRCTTSPNGRRL